MSTGHVKWFNNAKGYGFILCENSSEDFFVHYSSIQMDGYKTLKAGQSVSFDILEGPKGSHAINIQSNEASSTVEESKLEGAKSEGTKAENTKDDADDKEDFTESTKEEEAQT